MKTQEQAEIEMLQRKVRNQEQMRIEKLQLELVRQNSRLTEAEELVIAALGTDGEHHKQWYLVKILKELDPKFDLSKTSFDRGIAP